MTEQQRFGREITAMVIAFDEEANLSRTLSKLTFLDSVLLIDSGSTDGTLAITACFPNVRVLHRAFDTFAAQCNFGLSHVHTPWILSIDADYVLSDELVSEIDSLQPDPSTAGYSARFEYAVWGRKLKGTLYPPRTVLYRPRDGRYVDEGHGHVLRLAGHVERLKAPIIHDDRKPLTRWLASQQAYAVREAEHLLSSERQELRRADRLRLTGWIVPLLILPYVLLVKGCVFDGWPGWFYALQRLFAELSIALQLLDRRASAIVDDRRSGTTIAESIAGVRREVQEIQALPKGKHVPGARKGGS